MDSMPQAEGDTIQEGDVGECHALAPMHVIETWGSQAWMWWRNIGEKKCDDASSYLERLRKELLQQKSRTIVEVDAYDLRSVECRVGVHRNYSDRHQVQGRAR